VPMQSPERRRRISHTAFPAPHPAGWDLAETPIVLDAEAASFPPGQRLVVPQAASVETDIPANRSHIAQHRRCDGRGGLGKDRIVLPQEFRMLNDVECGQSADFDAISGLRTDAPQFWEIVRAHV